ncbi:hypothetical protein WME94_05940 [Sorangium sp. So ce429]
MAPTRAQPPGLRGRELAPKHPPAAPTKPSPTRIEPEAILAETCLLRHMLARCGVPAADRDGALQERLIGVAVALREERHRPEPGLHLRRTLQRWVIGGGCRSHTDWILLSFSTL